jgi:hypothetical protein
MGGSGKRRLSRPGPHPTEPTAGSAPARTHVPATPGRGSLATRADLLRLQHSAGNAATVHLLSGGRATPSTAPPAVRRAYWENVSGVYTWHGGDEQPPESYVKLSEPQRPNPNNKKKLYDIYGPTPAPSKKKKKNKGGSGGASTPPPQVIQGGAKPPKNKLEAAKLANQAPALMETAETQALGAATQMQRALTPGLAAAAAKAAQVAAVKAKEAATKLSDMVQRLKGFADLADDVRKYETCAVTASEAAAKFSAQATRLVAVVEARAEVQKLAQSVEDKNAKLKAARELAVQQDREAEYLRTYHADLSRDLATVGGGGTFKPTVDPGPAQAQLLLEIATAEESFQATTKEIKELEASVSTLEKEHGAAAGDVVVKELAVTTGAAGLDEAQGNLESRRALRILAGGEANLSTLLALPRFDGSLVALKPYLEALTATGLKPVAMVSLLSSLSATHSAAELATMATAVAGGADLTVTVGLAKVEPKVDAADVALFAKVQQAAACKLQVVVDLLPARTVPLYATQKVLTELAVLAKDGASPARMAEIIVGEPTLPPADLAELTKIFGFYPSKDDMLLLAKMVKEGMKGGRKSADVTTLLTELDQKGAAAPAAATVKALLQSDKLADFATKQVAAYLVALNGLTDAQMVEVSTWLAPLSAADKLGLITGVFVADGTAVAAIHATFQAMNKARLDGNAIMGRAEYLRGFITAPGGAANQSITTVGGQKVLTGPEIHAHTLNALAGPRPDLRVDALKKYPKGEDPSRRNADTLWLDANPAPRGVETADEAVRRQKLAVAELCHLNDVVPAIVQQILANNNGARPRAIMLPSAEDGLDPRAEAHTNDMHTIGGGGKINDYHDLAARACYSPTAAGRASAFKSRADAQAGMQAALDDYIGAGNWPWLRERLSKGYAVAIDRPVGAARLVSLQTNGAGGPNGLYDRDGSGTFLHKEAKPKYAGGRGGRKYYPGDGARIPQRAGFVTRGAAPTAAFETYGPPPDNQIPVEVTTLTTAAPITGVHLRVIGENVTGGFVVNSAYAY